MKNTLTLIVNIYDRITYEYLYMYYFRKKKRVTIIDNFGVKQSDTSTCTETNSNVIIYNEVSTIEMTDKENYLGHHCRRFPSFP